MADSHDEGADAQAEGEEKPKSKKKLIIIIVAVLLLVGIAAGAYFFLAGGEKTAEEGADGEHAEEGEHGEAEEPELDEHGKPIPKAVKGAPVYFEMPDMLVNLSTASGKPSFLKMRATLELSNADDVATIQAFLPRVTDSFNTYLRELRPTDLSGSAGLYRLREELMLRINQAIAPAKVNNILFREIIVQ